MNITIEEEDQTGKGASMLHYLLSIKQTENLVLFADNCVGQNKNNAILQYLLWWIVKKLNKSISLNFLLTGTPNFRRFAI